MIGKSGFSMRRRSAKCWSGRGSAGSPLWERRWLWRGWWPRPDAGRFSAEFLEEEKRELGADEFAREYGCELSDSGVGMFERHLVESAITDKVKPLFG